MSRNFRAAWHTLPSRRWALLLLAAAGCAGMNRPRSYLELPLDSEGRPSENPYVVTVQNGARAIALLGVVHSRDPADPLFDALERAFAAFAPDCLVHENVAPRALGDRQAAIAAAGDIGFAAHLAYVRGIPMRSGDLREAEEFPLLAERSGVEAALVFLTAQRLIVGMGGDLGASANEYAEFHRTYLVANGLPDNPAHRSWSGFEAAFERVVGYPPSTRPWNYEMASPLVERGPLNHLARLSHELRDQRLCSVIREMSTAHPRVMVVFGAWHILAIEPLAKSGALFGYDRGNG
ncbi:MAG: hypothetical protein K2P70_04615 [Hyphomonadaceae bacterium]|nr:hypothetical protein [Hyphomonadaceae bacterium]